MIDLPLRVRKMYGEWALAALDAELAKLYATDGRPSIAPSLLLRAALIQILFSIQSERQLMDQIVHREPRPAFEYEYCSQIFWRDPIGQGSDAAVIG